MSKFELKDQLDRALYKTYNLVSELLFQLDSSSKKTLRNNLAYKNKHRGERCFILGTGPSLIRLNESQIEVLSGEVVFGVNSLYKSNVVSTLTPKYYALLDNLYWGNWQHTFKDVASQYGESPPTFITDLRAKPFAQRANPAEEHIYIYSKKYPVSEMSARLDSNIYAAMNVISYCILTAIYMGFKDVYLLGCDYNAFCTSGKGHAYDDKSELSQTSYNLAFYLKFYWITTEFHYLIARLAKERGVSVVNLTPGSLLDAYNRGALEDILKTPK